MKTVELNTTQKITIEFELASPVERFLALLLDQVIVWFTTGILTLIVGLAFKDSVLSHLSWISRYGEYVWLFTFGIAIGFYSFYMEILLNGQTLGKKILGIKVIKLNGESPSITDYLIRWAFRIVDIWTSFLTVGFISIFSSVNNQRLGDMAAGTVLVKTKTSKQFKVSDLEKIKSNEDYLVSYPLVKYFSEKDMIAVKNVVNRYQLHKNKAHIDAVHETINKIAPLLEVKEGSISSGEELKFLKTILSDYIVLTR